MLNALSRMTPGLEPNAPTNRVSNVCRKFVDDDDAVPPPLDPTDFPPFLDWRNDRRDLGVHLPVHEDANA